MVLVMSLKRDRISDSTPALAVAGNMQSATIKTAKKRLYEPALDRILLIMARKYCFIWLLLSILLLRFLPAVDRYRPDRTGISLPVGYMPQSEALLCAVPTTRTGTTARARTWSR